MSWTYEPQGSCFYLQLPARRLPFRPTGEPVRLKQIVDFMFRLPFPRYVLLGVYVKK